MLVFSGWLAIPPAPAAPASPASSSADPHEVPGSIPESASSAWVSGVQREIREREYHITWQTRTHLDDLPQAWHAPNRAHNFRTYFTERGIRVIPRIEPAAEGSRPSWEWSLSLTGYGRGGRVRPVEQAVQSTDGNRIAYDRGKIIEWYVNDPRGLEQGFTLGAPPDEAGQAGPLSLVLDLAGSLSPVISVDGQSIDFVAPGGARAVHFAGLLVTDASGWVLPAWMEGFAQAETRGIRIVVDDADAVYPITVDPLATSPGWSAESDQDGAQLGYSVATAGFVNGDAYSDVIVGAYLYDNGDADEGIALVYYGSPSGPSLTPSWMAEGNQAGAWFGFSVATAGDVNGDGLSDVIVGAHRYDNGAPDEGQAFVYHGFRSGLLTTPAWTDDGFKGGAEFGSSVGPAGDVNGDGFADVIVGARAYTNGQAVEGMAAVYHGSSTGLQASPAWITESDQVAAYYGASVATAGDVNGDGYADVIVGAQFFDNGQTDEGRAYVYHGSGSGLSLTPAWTAESDQAAARFGISVATAGDVDGDGYADVIVGADIYDNGQTDEGRAYVYYGSGSGLSAGAGWTAEADQAGASFGHSVGTAGDTNGDGFADVVIGAFAYDNVEADEGRAFVYQGSAAGLPATPSWTVESDQAGAWLGFSAATAGDVNGDGYSDVIVGAHRFDNVQSDEGAAFVYPGSATGVSTVAAWTAESNDPNSRYGYSVATAGDVNGDGFADVILGSPRFDNGLTNEGQAFVYLGSSGGLMGSPWWTADGGQAAAEFGTSVATAGDVNGDGYDDIIVGAPYFDNVEVTEGRAFVYHGSATGPSATPSWMAEGNRSPARFGISVGTAGDVNGDGYADVIVGADWHDNGEFAEGLAFVYHGSAAGLSTAPDWMGESNQADSDFGRSVGTAGDVNGDGYSDVIVGAQYYERAGLANEGRAFVYHGSLSGLSTTAAWTADGDQGAAFLGWSVATAGDVNGDGFSDVIVGAYGYENDQLGEGQARVYHGSASGLSTTAAWTAEGDAFALFGHCVASAGDVNGDGYSDVVVGAYAYGNGGQARVYPGSASGLSPTASWAEEDSQLGAGFGWSVATAGDVNGDGYADTIVGAPFFDNGQNQEGRASLFYGNGGPGIGVRPQQIRADGTAPIGRLGHSESSSSFRLGLLGRTPFGRGRIRLESEVRPFGAPFTKSATHLSSPWVDSNIAGLDMNELISGLAPGTLYHWRARLRYAPSSTPYQQAGPWLTIPVNGWEEGDLRTRLLADLSVTQTDTPDPVLLGAADVTYSLQVGNSGPDPAPVLLTDTIPAGSSYQSATPSQGSCGFAGSVVTCSLGSVAGGGSASVDVVVTPLGYGVLTNTAFVSMEAPGQDPDLSDNTTLEQTEVVPPTIGDRVWEDINGNGLQDPNEPGMSSVLVVLYDPNGVLAASTVTPPSGAYLFTNVTVGHSYYVRFFPPAEWTLTAMDQGNDSLDSDADPTTYQTPLFSLLSASYKTDLDAGVIPYCVPPDEPVWVYAVTLSTDGNNYPILHFQDANQLSQRTGYNVYRSPDPAPDPSTWPLFASDIIDMDQATPNYQWTDTSGDVSPSGIWYYHVTATNHRCPAEGPF